MLSFFASLLDVTFLWKECWCLFIFNHLFLGKPSEMLQNSCWKRWDFWTVSETSGHITVFQVDYLYIIWKNISWDLPWTVQKYFPVESKGYKVRCSLGLEVLLFLFLVFSVHQNVFTIIRPFCRHKYRTSLAVTPRLKGLSHASLAGAKERMVDGRNKNSQIWTMWFLSWFSFLHMICFHTKSLVLEAQ